MARGDRESERLADARKTLKASFGEALASKASDSFALAFGFPTRQLFAEVGLENVAAVAPVATTAILEFRSPPRKASRVREEVSRTREETTMVVESLVSDSALESVRLSVDAGGRHQLITQLRDEFFNISGPIKDHLDSAVSAKRERIAGRERLRETYTETCWLNGTVRAEADPQALAEIAASEEIERLDLPRLLQRDVSNSIDAIGAPVLREETELNGQGVTVAVIDSEVLLDHAALAGRVIHKRNFTRESWNTPDDHGTAVAGLIAADSADFSGVAPAAHIYNYKVLATDEAFNGANFDGWVAIQQALEDGARIPNCSWGIGIAASSYSKSQEAFDTAWELGLTIVKSAGNQGPHAGTITDPGDAQGVIVVGATNVEATAVQDYSSRGPLLDGSERPHLVAPGGTRKGGLTSTRIDGSIGAIDAGTSFAAPHVSGVLALILERQSSLTPDELRDMILESCVPIAGYGANDQGAGFMSIGGLFP